MKQLSVTCVLGVFCFGCPFSSEEAFHASPSVDACGDVRVDVQADAVVNGSLVPEHILLSEGQKLAIGRTPGCTATLIAPEWAVTAQHCLTEPGHQFCIGQDPSSIDSCIQITEVYDHEDYNQRFNWDADLTLLKLAGSALEIAPDIVPIPIQSSTMQGWEGATLESAGYGVSEQGSGTRYFNALPVRQVGDPFITLDGTGSESGICFGDSGGPLLGDDDGVVRIVGLHSHIWGSPECQAYSNHLRVDLYVDWILERIEFAGDDAFRVLESQASSCGGLSSEGYCQGNTSFHCRNGMELRVSCGLNSVCGWSDAESGYRCISPSDDPCDGVSALGTCEGDVAVWCDRGTLRSRDCGACGATCGEASWGVDCVIEDGSL
ncbi:MAG: trypsin-like serine protease [Myxococcota bacterium]